MKHQAIITEIYEHPKDEFSITVTEDFEKDLLKAIEDNTELSMIDFIMAEKTAFVEDGVNKVTYKWKCKDISEEKYNSFHAFVMEVFKRFHHEVNKN